MADTYRRVEWLGGPLDGTEMMVRQDATSIVYPHTISVINQHKSPTITTDSWTIPIGQIGGTFGIG